MVKAKVERAPMAIIAREAIRISAVARRVMTMPKAVMPGVRQRGGGGSQKNKDDVEGNCPRQSGRHRMGSRGTCASWRVRADSAVDVLVGAVEDAWSR